MKAPVRAQPARGAVYTVALYCALALYLPAPRPFAIAAGMACLAAAILLRARRRASLKAVRATLRAVAALPFPLRTVSPSGAARRLPPQLARAGIGVLAGVLLSTLAFARPVSTGFASAELARIEGAALEDSRESRKGGMLYSVRLESAESASGRCDAAGTATLWCEEGPVLRAGERFRARAPRFSDAGIVIIDDLESRGFGEGLLPAIALARANAYDAVLAAAGRVGGESNAFLKALLFGFKDELDPGVDRLFRDSGCLHVLALSGQHLAIAGALVQAVLGLVFARRTSGIVSCCLVLGYAFLVGMPPSIARAAIMYAHLCVASLAGRKVDPRASLAFSFLVQAIAFPSIVYGASFILSYGALFGIMVLGSGLASRIAPFMPVFLRESVSSSLAAQAGTSGYTVAALGSFRIAGIPATVATARLVEWFMYLGIAGTLAVAFVPPLAPVFAFALDGLWYLMRLVMGFCARLPGIDHRMGDGETMWAVGLAGWALVACLCALVYAWPYVEHARRTARRYKPRQRSQPPFNDERRESGRRTAAMQPARAGGEAGLRLP